MSADSRPFDHMLGLDGMEREEAACILDRILPRLSYKDWRFYVNHAYWMLVVTVRVRDSTQYGHPWIELQHNLRIPGREFVDERTAVRWLLERVFDIERHEAMEYFLIDGAAPFFPDHSPEANPYAVRLRDEPVRTSAPPPQLSGGNVASSAVGASSLARTSLPAGPVPFREDVVRW